MEDKKKGVFCFRKALVVGSWAKEHITIKNIKKKPSLKVFSYMDTLNPGIASLVDDYRIGSLYDINNIKDYAREKNVDVVLVTTAAPLAKGLCDLLKENEIPAFGPVKEAARLETDKEFARKLLKSISPSMVPEFSVFQDVKCALAYAEKFNYEIAVKPVGLTEGLGVKVFGDQLKNKKEVTSYIEEILEQKIGGKPRVLLEEKVTGQEFTIQAFLKGENIIPTPAVQDFKRLYSGDKGVNTASMGSFSDSNYVLPFLGEEDFKIAVEIIKKTILNFTKKTNIECCGFLSGQFMITEKGVKLIEYNFRPGDPEWLNTVAVLKNNILEVVEDLFNKKENKLDFNNKAVVCKYAVPVGYPEKKNLTLDLDWSQRSLAKYKAQAFFSCGKDESGKLKVGSERGVSFLSISSDIITAHNNLEEFIKHIKGRFYHRDDIGSKKMIDLKVAANKQIQKKRKEIIIRNPEESEFTKVYNFVCTCKPLETYGEHFFKIIFRYFKNSCFVAEFNFDIVGFVFGFKSQVDPDNYFIWQIGVSSEIRGKGIGVKLLRQIENNAKELGCKKLELTVDPKNAPSQKLFDKLKYKNISAAEGDTVVINKRRAVKDYYGKGSSFILYGKELSS